MEFVFFVWWLLPETLFPGRDWVGLLYIYIYVEKGVSSQWPGFKLP